MENSRTKNTIINSTIGIVLRIISVALSFVIRTVFIRILGVEYTGVSTVFTDILTVLSFAELGIGTAITFALYKPIAEKDEEKIAALMDAYKKIYRVIAVIVFVVGMLLLPFLNHIIKDVPNVKEDIRLIYIFYIVNTSSSYLLIYKSTFLIATQKEYTLSKIRIIISVLKCIFECIILIVFKQFYLYLALNVFFGVFQNYITAKKADSLFPFLKNKANKKLTKTELKKIFSDVRALFIYKISGVILGGTDSIIISSFLGTGFVGFISNYNLIINQVYALVMQVFTATSASVGNLAASSSQENQYTVFKRLEFLCFSIYIVILTCLWNVTNTFINIWLGAQYVLSNTTLLLLLVDFFIKGMMSPVTSFRTSNGLFVQGKYRPLIMSIINIVVSIILVKPLGINGVILGTICSRVSTQLWYDPYLIFKKVFCVKAKEYFLKYFYYAAIVIFSCASTNIFNNFISLENMYVSFFVESAISVLMSVLLIVVFFKKSAEFKYFVSLAKNLLRGKIT